MNYSLSDSLRKYLGISKEPVVLVSNGDFEGEMPFSRKFGENVRHIYEDRRGKRKPGFVSCFGISIDKLVK